jgi:glycosyltransferase involved in cell wall biosynthesis
MSAKKQIAVIGTVGLPANYGGFETLTEHLVKNMGAQYDLTVYCSGKRYPKKSRKPFHGNAKLHYIPLEANGIQSIFYDSWAILHALRYADVLLILGVAGAWLLPFVRLFTNKKIVISIDGIEWKRDKWNWMAKCYLWWAESIAVRYSHIDIADNESIQDYTAVRYNTLSRIVEYGADHTLQVIPSADDKNMYPFLRAPYAFKVCRIEPENNVHEVLKAFSELPEYVLVIVGNWTKSEYGIRLREQYSNYTNIMLFDPIYDQRSLDLLRSNAFVYVHGHSAGGTNPSLVEAMSLGLPILAYGVSYNRTTTEESALYFTDAESLRNLIRKTPVKKLMEIGRRMKRVAQRRYTWKLISLRYESLIQEAIQTKTKSVAMPRMKTLDHDILLKHEASHLTHAQLFYEQA